MANKLYGIWEAFVSKAANIIINNRVLPAPTQVVSSTKDNKEKPFCFDVEEHDEIDSVFKTRTFDLQKGCEVFIDIFSEIPKSKNDAEKKIVLFERWRIGFDSSKTSVSVQNPDSQMSAGYKKAMVTMRSLFSQVLLLPTHRLQKRANSLKRKLIKYAISFKQNDKIGFEGSPTTHYTFLSIVLSQTATIKLDVQYRREVDVDKIMDLTAPKLVVFDKYISTPVQESNETITASKPPASASEPKPISGAASKNNSQNAAASAGSSTPISIPSSNKGGNNSGSVKKHEIYGATPPFSSVGSLEKSSPMISASPMSPPYPKEFIDQLGSSYKNKQFKLPFSPWNDAPIQQRAYGSSLEQSSAAVNRDIISSTAALPNAANPAQQQQILPNAILSQQDEIIEEDQPFNNPGDCVPGFLQDDDNLMSSSGGVAANQMMQAADIEDVDYGFAPADANDENQSFWYQLEHAPKLKAFSDEEMHKKGLVKSLSSLYGDLDKLKKAKQDLLGLKEL